MARTHRESMRLELKGFETFHQMMKGGSFESVFNQLMRKKNKALRELAKARLTKTISGGSFLPNTAVTIAIKGSAKPLIDHGDFFGQVGAKGSDYGMGFIVGVKRVTKSGLNLAHMLETGWSQDVTPKMRIFFATMARKTGKFKPLSKGTTKLYVSPRPYMKIAFFHETEFTDFVVREWKGVIHETFMAFVQKGRAESYK